MNFDTTLTKPSKVAPGVTYTFHQPNGYRRANLSAQVRPKGAVIDCLLDCAKSVSEGNGENKALAFMAINGAVGDLLVCIKSIGLNVFLAGVQGLQLDGVEPTVQKFIEAAPPKLFDEAADLLAELLQSEETGSTGAEEAPAGPSPKLFVVN